VSEVSEFVLELYISRSDPDAVESEAERIRFAAEELSREGTPVRFLRSIFVPDDETCFHLFQAASAEAVLEAAHRASLTYDRIARATETDGNRLTKGEG
jgi:hypothetical protein